MKLLSESAMENIVNKGAFSRTRDPCDTGEDPEGDLHIDVLKVVVARADNAQGFTVHGAPSLWYLDSFCPTKVLSGDRLWIAHDVARCARLSLIHISEPTRRTPI